MKIDGELEDVLKASFKGEQPTQIELIRMQAISIRDDYDYLEGEEFPSDDFIIDSIVVAQFNKNQHNEFIVRYYDVNSDIDAIALADLMTREFYTVLVLCRDNGTVQHSDIFYVLNQMCIELDMLNYKK